MIALLLALAVASGPSTLWFSCGDLSAWQRVSANGQVLGPVPGTPLAPEAPECHGMWRMANGRIAAATDRFHLFDGDVRDGGPPVEAMAGSSGRHLYRVMRGRKLPLRTPLVEHVARLDEINPRTWTVTRSWTLPGFYRHYGEGNLSVDPTERVAYYATERSPVFGTDEHLGVVHRHDLVNDSPLSDLVSRNVGAGGLLVMLDGSVIVGYKDGARRYSPIGELLKVFAAGAIRVGQGLVSAGSLATSFWVQGFAEGAAYSTMFEMDAGTGDTLHQWNTPNNGVQWDAPFVEPPPELTDTVIVTSGLFELRAYDSITGALLVTNTDGLNSPLSVLRLTTDRTKVIATDGDTPLHVEQSDSDTLALLSTTLMGGGLVSSVRFAIDAAGFLYFQRNSAGQSIISKVDQALTTVWERTVALGDGAFIEVNPAGTELYSVRTSDNRVRAYDIVADSMLSDFATLAADEVGNGICRDAAGNIYVHAAGDSAGFSGSKIYAFTPSGTLIFSTTIYAINGGVGVSVGGIAVSPDGLRVWSRSTTPGHAWLYAHSAVDGTFIRSIDGADTDLSNSPGIVVHGVPMPCPDPCEDAGIGEPVYGLAAEQNTTLFYDAAFTLISSFSSPLACQLVAESRGTWVCMDDNVGGTSILFLVDPATIDVGTGEATIIRGPILTEVRIGELGGARALYVLNCDRLLTSERSTHQLIEICLPKDPGKDPVTGLPLGPEGVALVGHRYALFVDPIDGWLIDSTANFLYVEAGVAKVWNLANDAPLRTIGSVGGRQPFVLNDNSFLVYTGSFLSGVGDFLRYTRTGALIKRYNGTASGVLTFSQGVWSFVADLQTDLCQCGNGKDGRIVAVGEDDAQALPISLLNGNLSPYIQLPDVVEGGVNTAVAFITLNPSAGSGFSETGGGTPGSRQPNRSCGPESGVTSVAPNAGCNMGGRGWVPTYTGASGVVPVCTDPSGEETFTGKNSMFTTIKVVHSNAPSGPLETLRFAMVDLDDPQRAEGRVELIGDVEHGMGDGQGQMVSTSLDITLMDADGRPMGSRLGDPARKYFAGDEVIIEARSDWGRRNGAIPRRLCRAVLRGSRYGSQLSRITGVDPLHDNTGGFSPDKDVPQFTVPLAHFTAAPADLAQRTMPIIMGEVSDEGAVSPITNLPSPKGKCPLFYTGIDGLGTGPGGEPWGSFLLCLFAVYDIPALYGSDLGAMGLYGRLAYASTVQVGGTDATEVALDGAPDLSNLATDETAQIVLWTDGGRVEMRIVAADDFAKTVVVNGLIDPVAAQGVSWYISSIDYAPRRVKIDLATRNGVDCMVPHWAGYIRPTLYEDFTSVEGDYRVTKVWVRGPLLMAHLGGEITLAANVVGVEDKGDGTGLPIIDYYIQCNFLWDNVIHRQLRAPIGGLWPQLEAQVPLWSDGFSKTKQSSFTAAQALSAAKIGGRGLQGSMWLGEAVGTRDFAQLLADNGDCQFYEDEYCRINVYVFDETVDTSVWPRIVEDQRVFGAGSEDNFADDEIMNWIKGGCDHDPEFAKYREGDMKAVSNPAIARNKTLVKYSKHMDLKLLAYKAQAQFVLDRKLFAYQDGAEYVTIDGMDFGGLDYPIGSGIRYTAQGLPGTSGFVDRPMVILHRRFQFSTHTIVWTCLDLQPYLIPLANRLVASNTVGLMPVASNTPATEIIAAS